MRHLTAKRVSGALVRPTWTERRKVWAASTGHRAEFPGLALPLLLNVTQVIRGTGNVLDLQQWRCVW